MGIRQFDRGVSAAELGSLARDLLAASALCAIATVSPDRDAHINTAYFAWTDLFDLVWLSEPAAKHSRNLGERSTAAIAVYDSGQTWGDSDRGIQLFGIAGAATGQTASKAEAIYAARFPGYRAVGAGAYLFYRFRPQLLKLFDETSLGSGVFVTARVTEGALGWVSTEVYGPDS
jgi:uncharacterized protein YhbP (UPF0306 family)